MGLRGAVRRWRDMRITHLLQYSVHNPALGLARSFIAVGLSLGLVFTPTEHLFFVSPERPDGRVCEGIVQHTGLFCVVPSSQLEVARWAAVAMLIVVAGGWRPRWTAIPHWWVAYSFFSSSNVMDGGDQVAASLTLALIPICLTDSRRWHWSSPVPGEQRSPFGSIVSGVALYLVWIQVFVIYLHSSIAKLGGDEWQDGSAFWYWGLFPPFGVPDYLQGIMGWALASGAVVLAVTWGSMALEFFLAWCLFARWEWRMFAFVLGAALHIGIAVLMGLPGFSLVMLGALVLYLIRPGDPVPSRVVSGKAAENTDSERTDEGRVASR